MSERKSETPAATDRPSELPWQVPVALEDVEEDGRHVDLVADEAMRAAIARVAGVRELPRLEAHFDLKRHGADGLHVTGHVSAVVGQNCVVTLEPLTNDIEEDVDLLFASPPPQAEGAGKQDDDEKPARSRQKLNAPEPLVGGAVDLGTLATEFLLLGIDPYPRKPGAVFQAPQDAKPEPGPFAALASLKGRQGSQ